MTSVETAPRSTPSRRARELPGLPEPAERRRLREAWKLTPRQVASAFGVTAATVRSWESGLTSPTGERREAYARFLRGLAQEPRPPRHRPPASGPQTRPGARSAAPAATAPLTAPPAPAGRHSDTAARVQAAAPVGAVPPAGPAPAGPVGGPAPGPVRSPHPAKASAPAPAAVRERPAGRGAPHPGSVPGARSRPAAPAAPARVPAGGPAGSRPAADRIRDRDLALTATALSAWLLILVLAQAFPSVLAG
ncbi:helix-turn-helix transcriptional regulator [Streptomyces subrutilus]|uniref:helix-turn-helix domain-containing protein n=1 Tax=Streptomyces subrutilus TaxID=36818 RepID=UPI0034183CFC